MGCIGFNTMARSLTGITNPGRRERLQTCAGRGLQLHAGGVPGIASSYILAMTGQVVGAGQQSEIGN
ncbi:MAG: hypothetical protein R2764_03050 [Bacteroidales bacterium]